MVGALTRTVTQHAHYQIEQGRPNSAFLHLGTAARKALSAGLHKDAPTPTKKDGDVESTEERRTTFWSLYFYEMWAMLSVHFPCKHLTSRLQLDLFSLGTAEFPVFE